MTPKADRHRPPSDRTLRFFLKSIARIRPVIQRMILFGSRAHGTALPDSDYDILLIVPVKTDELLDTLYEAVIETLLTSGRLVSLKIFTESEYDRLKKLSTPFMQRIEAEGVLVG